MGERRKFSTIHWFRNIVSPFIGALLFFFALFLFPEYVEAATISFSPSSGSYKVGQTFSVGVYVGSGDQAMNAVEGVIAFPRDLVEVTALSKGGSILNLWVQEPTYSNTNGTVSFEGIVYNPGFTGSVGKIITITFRAKASGTAAVSFSNGSVLANDGAGTNILSQLGRGNYTIGDGEVKPPTTIPLPQAPKVTSATHPDQSKWYANNNPTFEWSLSSDITGVNILTDHEEATDPGTKSDGRMSSFTYPNVEDGVWYFHIRFQNARGWGPMTHYRFQIDQTKPEGFSITEIPRATTTDSIAKFMFLAEDKLSGIDSYEISIDATVSTTWRDDGGHVFTAPSLDPGLHTLRARAFDKAGNFLENSVSFEVVAPPKPVAAPIVEKPAPVVTPVEQSFQFMITDNLILLVSGAIFFILLLVLLILLILYVWYKFKLVRKHLNEDPESAHELEESLSKIFTVLRGKIEEYSLLVEKTRVKKKLAEHTLDEEETRILSDFKKYLDSADKIMRKFFRK